MNYLKKENTCNLDKSIDIILPLENSKISLISNRSSTNYKFKIASSSVPIELKV